MDHFCLKPVEQYSQTNQKYLQVAILINGLALIDLIRPIEKALISNELEQFGSSFHRDDAFPIAASYMYPTIYLLKDSQREFFGPIESMFTIETDDPTCGKTCILDCDCGNFGCWPLLVRISRIGSTVTWTEFSQFYRDWIYNLGPFQFDREQYEYELYQYRNAF
jgi:hypothetical protein